MIDICSNLLSSTMKITLFLFVIFAGCELAKCAEILAVVPTPFYSHQATFRPLWRELAKKGHKVTLITTDLMESNENITQIDYSKFYEILDKKAIFDNGMNLYKIVKKVSKILDDIMAFQFDHPGLQELIKKNKTFDVMLAEIIMPGWPLLSVKFKCPLIGLSTMDGNSLMHNAVGNVIHPVIYPYADLAIGPNPSFMERVKSIAFTSILTIFENVMGSFTTSYVRKYVGQDLPEVMDVMRKIDMIFVNSNPVFFPPRPVTPATINLGGGLHLSEPKKLPEDLQKYLDDSKEGCIYVSFGTTVNSEYLSEEQKNTFVNVFKSMAPIKILWKFDDLNVAKGAKNIEVRKWLPQQDVLRHPNVKLFITQGGLQSMEEAIDSAVPMLGMPFYGDQLNNVNKMHDKKFGLRLNPTDMTEKTLKSSIDELLQNPSYKQMTNKISAIAKDQPMNGLEKAVWWTEYVIRHGGTQHLRSPSADIPLYQYFFLDVISVTVAIMYVAYIIMKRVLRLACRSIRSLKDLYYARKEKKE